MAEDKPTYEQVQDLLNTWNKPVTDNNLAMVLGEPVPEGDTRATAAVRSDVLDHDRNPGRDDIDAERLFADDGDDDEDSTEDEESDSYDDMTVTELKAEIDSRNEDREEDDHLSKTGNKADLVARLEADDESADDEEDDGEE